MQADSLQSEPPGKPYLALLDSRFHDISTFPAPQVFFFFFCFLSFPPCHEPSSGWMTRAGSRKAGFPEKRGNTPRATRRGGGHLDPLGTEGICSFPPEVSTAYLPGTDLAVHRLPTHNYSTQTRAELTFHYCITFYPNNYLTVNIFARVLHFHR